MPSVSLRHLAGGFQFVQFLKGPEGTQAYVIGPEGARKLIEGLQTVHDPVDNYMDQFWDHGVRCLGVKPWRIETADGASTIDRAPHVAGHLKLRFKIARQLDSQRRKRWLKRYPPMAAVARNS